MAKPLQSNELSFTSQPHVLVLFDIDGTLLYSTSHKLRERFSYAVEQIHGKQVNVDWEQFEGAIDNTILKSLLRQIGVEESHITTSLPHVHEKAYEHFEMHVTESYSESILPGAKQLLETLKSKVHIGVLTGNYEKTAWKKLEMVGLRSYFDFGLFGHEADDRNELALAIFDKAKIHFGKDFPASHIVLIGDTPRDIACARTIQAKVIAVATGKYTEETLQSHDPDLLVRSLDDKRIIEFISKVA